MKNENYLTEVRYLTSKASLLAVALFLPGLANGASINANVDQKGHQENRANRFQPRVHNNLSDRSIRGLVTDAKGDPIPGVSIVVKGTQRGTTTDGQGQFSLSIPDEATLVFSYVGYKTKEISVGSKSNLTISLDAEDKVLNEVVVVGYGTQSRRNVTGSVTKVNLKQTETTPSPNIAQALRGRVAGVQFTDNGRPGQTGQI